MASVFTEEQRRVLGEAVKGMPGPPKKIDNAVSAAIHAALHALYSPDSKVAWGKHPEGYPGGSLQYSKDGGQLARAFIPVIKKFYDANKDRFK